MQNQSRSCTPVRRGCLNNLKQFTWFIEIKHLTEVWAYGRVFYTSSGFHGEYHSPDLQILSILYLGPDEDQALHMMKTITQQHLYMLSLKELY